MKDKLKRIILSLDILSKLKNAGIFNPATTRLLVSAHIKSDPTRKYEQLETAITLSQMFMSPFSQPDLSVDGVIRIAYTENRIPVGINPEECHFLIAGQTGCGKTVLLKIIFVQAINQGCKIWLFAKAPDHRSLLNVNKNILVINFKSIKINLLEPPPGIEFKDWVNIIIDIIIQAFRLYDGSKNFLQDCLYELYAKFSTTGHYPCLFDLYDYVKEQKFPLISRTSRYQESILNRLGGLLHSSLGPVFDCSQGYTKHLINHNVIFEILYLTAEHQVLMVNYLLTYLYMYKLINEFNLRHFVGIDDANLIFDASFEKRPDLGLPIIHHLLTEVRKSKITIFACTQTPHQVGASIHSNAFAKIILPLSNGKDIECMQQSMGIKDPEQKAYCYKLKPREAIVKFSSRYQEPFLATIPEVTL